MDFTFMGAAEAVSSSNSAVVRLSEFPGENPTVEEVITFLDANEPLVQTAYGSELRGETPPALVHLSEPEDLTGFVLITDPTEARTASGMKHNFSVRQALKLNATRKKAFDAAMLERSNALAQAIDLSMRRTAPLRLQALQAVHAVPALLKTFNGIAMWRDIISLRTSTGLTEEYIDHDREVERARDERLPDGCCVQDFTDKVVTVVRDHIPYMDRPFRDEAKKAEFIIRLMPESNAAEGRSLLRRLRDAGTLTPSDAIRECTEIVKESQSSESRRVAAAARLVAKDVTAAAALAVAELVELRLAEIVVAIHACS